MSLTDRINNDIKEAMRSKDQGRLAALRAVKSALLLAATEKNAGGEVSEGAELKVLQKLVKQRKESADIYVQQDRQDMADDELAQASVIEAYLPAQMDEGEVREIIQGVISDVGASSPADMGKVMGPAMGKLAGKADGKLISDIVKELLSG